MDGLKKAALFLSSLDCTAADKLLSRLDGESARSIRREIMSLRHHDASANAVQQLDKEFLEHAGWQPTGNYREFQFVNSSKQAQAAHQPNTAGQSRPGQAKQAHTFAFLRHWSIGDIVSAIIDEHPQTIAIVLAHLPQSQMYAVLAAFPPELQRNIQDRLERYEMPSAEVIQEIESALRVRYRRQAWPARRAQPLETFEEIGRLSDSELTKLFRSVDLVTAMHSLIGAPPTLIARATRHLSPTEEAEMRKFLKRLNCIDEEDVLQAREYVVEQYNGMGY